MTVATRVRISLETGCDFASCALFAHPLYKQLSGGQYDECAVMTIPDMLSTWRDEHRTARKRADRAHRRGYQFKIIERHKRVDELKVINTSTHYRQGRPMSSGYYQTPTQVPLPDYPCDRHRINTYGVEDQAGTLVAYAYIYRAGELALVSQILGHYDHLENEVMWLLMNGVVSQENPDGLFVYNRWDSGTDGLRWFKERCGFEPMEVEWAP